MWTTEQTPQFNIFRVIQTGKRLQSVDIFAWNDLRKFINISASNICYYNIWRRYEWSHRLKCWTQVFVKYWTNSRGSRVVMPLVSEIFMGRITSTHPWICAASASNSKQKSFASGFNAWSSRFFPVIRRTTSKNSLNTSRKASRVALLQ